MFENENKEFSEHLVTINRVAKVVKGGRRFGFAAIMIVGDNKGRVGYGTGKAKEVPEAVRKATENAKNKMKEKVFFVPVFSASCSCVILGSFKRKQNSSLRYSRTFWSRKGNIKISCSWNWHYSWRSNESTF